ncbi:hypothetical protein M9Y10_014439 [Tritrichomonas musculus]|uniref:Uncharacterized protein n=1 Tax=Tritrichomonas musculus TaxID=1915356 RepID=A0ABR2KZH4_9EUKA
MSVLTPIQDRNVNDKEAFVINETNKLVFYDETDLITVNLYLSSNYRDLYIITTKSYSIEDEDTDTEDTVNTSSRDIDNEELLIHLPDVVDTKDEQNLINDVTVVDKSLITKYKLVVDNTNKENSTLVFIEKEFRNINESYIILYKEYNNEYDNYDTKNYCFSTDINGNIIKTKEPTPIYIFMGFEKEEFLKSWNKVRLRNKDEETNKYSFQYYLDHYNRRGFPIINVFKQAVTSPILSLGSHTTSRNKPKIPTLILQQTDNDNDEVRPKIKQTLNEVRPKKILPNYPTMLSDLNNNNNNFSIPKFKPI